MGTAFVLTGGGSLGVVQAGMLAALHDHGIEPDLLVGTSAGALNAAYLAGPGTTADRLDSLADLWRRVRRRDVFAPHPRRWLAATLGAAPSLFGDADLRALVERSLGFDSLEDARVPVHVLACDIVTGRGVALTQGPSAEAVLASSAVPGLLPPVPHGGRTLVDGAVGDLDALAHAETWGASQIYLLPAGYTCAGPAPTTAVGTVLTALSLLLHRQLLAQVRGYHGRARLHVLPPALPAVGVPGRLHPRFQPAPTQPPCHEPVARQRPRHPGHHRVPRPSPAPGARLDDAPPGLTGGPSRVNGRAAGNV